MTVKSMKKIAKLIFPRSFRHVHGPDHWVLLSSPSWASAGWDVDYIREEGTTWNYVIGFLFYLVNYFIVGIFQHGAYPMYP